MEILVHPEIPTTYPDISVGYIPDGYTCKENSSHNNRVSLIFQNADGNSIRIQYNQLRITQQIDIEHYIVKDIRINSSEGKLLSALDAEFDNILFWYSENGTYTIITDLPERELIKIAESIK